MKFSVLMSVYSKEKPEFFLEAVESVINQTINPAEIIIVKDGELTESLEEVCSILLHKYPSYIRFVSLEKNVGLGLALQRGVLECRYDLIARMDTDDISKSDRFEKQLKAFAANPSLAICGGFIEEFSNTPQQIDSIRSVPLNKEAIYAFAKKRNPFNHMTVMFNKKAVLDVGNYQPLLLLEDYYLWFRLIMHKQDMINLPDVLVMARTGKDMFMRRGGWEYFVREKKLYDIFFKEKYINIWQYMIVIFIRFMSRVIPNKIRFYLYYFFIRKSAYSK